MSGKKFCLSMFGKSPGGQIFGNEGGGDFVKFGYIVMLRARLFRSLI